MRKCKSPTQLRGKKRVEHLLIAADHEISKVGYDAVTMSQIAKGAGSAIGSLYQFFPNKEAIVRELRMKYCKDLQTIWTALKYECYATVDAFSSSFVDVTLSFLKEHPSFLALIYAPSSTRNPEGARDLELTLFELLRNQTTIRSKLYLERKSASILQICKSMMTMYAGASLSDKRWIVSEFKSVVSAYVSSNAEVTKKIKPLKREKELTKRS